MSNNEIDKPWLTPTPDPYADFDKQSVLILMGQCILGEAEGESAIAKLAVGYVIVNRMNGNYWPKDAHKVILQPRQFQCFDLESSRADIIREPQRYVEEAIWNDCFLSAVWALHGVKPDPTDGANHYHTDNSSPDWSKNKTPNIKIGSHLFFKL